MLSLKGMKKYKGGSACTAHARTIQRESHRIDRARKCVLRLKEARPCQTAVEERCHQDTFRRWQLLAKWNRSNAPTTTVPPGATVARAMASLAVRRDIAATLRRVVDTPVLKYLLGVEFDFDVFFFSLPYYSNFKFTLKYGLLRL